jgi:hypothetical protein
MSPTTPTKGQPASEGHSRQDSLFDTDSPTEEDFVYEGGGDYSTRLGEVLSESEDSDGADTETRTRSAMVRAALGAEGGASEDDDDEGFVYEGKDAEPAGTYRDQLKEVLSDDGEEEYGDGESFQYPEGGSVGEIEEVEGDRSLRVAAESVVGSDVGQVSYARVCRFCVQFTDTRVLQRSLSTSPPPRSRSASFASEFASSQENEDDLGDFAKQTRPFLHPSVSRLRSSIVYTPQLSTDGLSPLRESVSSSPSKLTTLSHTSSLSNIHASAAQSPQAYNRESQREPFRWTSLQIVNELVYFNRRSKATAVLGHPTPGTPTTLAANSLICIGTDTGKVWVFDFKQRLLCICGDEQNGASSWTFHDTALQSIHTPHS